MVEDSHPGGDGALAKNLRWRIYEDVNLSRPRVDPHEDTFIHSQNPLSNVITHCGINASCVPAECHICNHLKIKG